MKTKIRAALVNIDMYFRLMYNTKLTEEQLAFLADTMQDVVTEANLQALRDLDRVTRAEVLKLN